MAFDRLASSLEAIVRAVVGPRLDYAAAWPARVVSQNANGSLDIQPDDARWPGLQRVPIAYGVPGISVQVAAGARVLLEFAGGNPSAPRVTLWDSASVTSLTVSAGAINLAGSAQAAVLGTQFMTDFATLVASIGTAVGGITGSGAAAGTAIASALVTFQAVPHLSGTVKVG